MLAHDGLDSVGSLIGVVEGDGADIMVQDVGLNNAVEEVSTNETHLTIDGGSSATDEVPLVTSVVRKRGISVLEKSDGDKPVVNPEVREEVPDEHVGETKLPGEEGETSGGQDDANVAHNDELCIPVLVKRTARIEMVDTTTEAVSLALSTALTLTLVVIMASDVSEKVVGPSNELLADEHHEAEDGCLFGELR